MRLQRRQRKILKQLPSLKLDSIELRKVTLSSTPIQNVFIFELQANNNESA